MGKLKRFVAALMLLFVLNIAAPQALAGDVGFPPGDIHIPGITGDILTPGFADWASALVLILGNSWNV